MALTLHDGSDGRFLAHCKKSHCGFTDILAAGYRDGRLRPIRPNVPAARQSGRPRPRSVPVRRRFAGGGPAHRRNSAEAYLREARGITCPLPPTQGFTPNAGMVRRGLASALVRWWRAVTASRSIAPICARTARAGGSTATR